MSAHTSESWRVGRPTKYGTRSPDTVMTVAKDEDGFERAIAHVYGVPSNCKLEEIKDDPRYARGLTNAYLLAEAPKLFRALKAASDGWDSKSEKRRAAAWKLMQAAITAAERE